MFTTFDVYSFGAFLHDYWCCKQGKIKKGEVRRTDSRTLPTVFDWTSPIHSAGEIRKGNIYFSRWRPTWNKKEQRSPTSMGKQYPMLVTFPTASILIVAFKEQNGNMFPTKNNIKRRMNGCRHGLGPLPIIVATFLTPFYSRCTLPLGSHNFSD